ncbi:MAG: hypothetical protein BECKG1743D_GA0114223_111732 [Candidatus Kentron sp. G]|nr:MAG: hypothetical protein BECKG1743E_GA0114224_111252 [Candidatus Kentron sp. G]VFN07876.1 MAG: hypothetical protein BECKG1743D_GA0114223_111732 [Candidatus Kentron sp. G]
MNPTPFEVYRNAPTRTGYVAYLPLSASYCSITPYKVIEEFCVIERRRPARYVRYWRGREVVTSRESTAHHCWRTTPEGARLAVIEMLDEYKRVLGNKLYEPSPRTSPAEQDDDFARFVLIRSTRSDVERATATEIERGITWSMAPSGVVYTVYQIPIVQPHADACYVLRNSRDIVP